MELRVVKFGSSWCKPCGVLDKNLEGKNYEKIDVEKEQEEAIKYGVKNIPVVLFFKDDILVERKVGVFTSDEFDNIVKNILDNYAS